MKILKLKNNKIIIGDVLQETDEYIILTLSVTYDFLTNNYMMTSIDKGANIYLKSAIESQGTITNTAIIKDIESAQNQFYFNNQYK